MALVGLPALEGCLDQLPIVAHAMDVACIVVHEEFDEAVPVDVVGLGCAEHRLARYRVVPGPDGRSIGVDGVEPSAPARHANLVLPVIVHVDQRGLADGVARERVLRDERVDPFQSIAVGLDAPLPSAVASAGAPDDLVDAVGVDVPDRESEEAKAARAEVGMLLA